MIRKITMRKKKINIGEKIHAFFEEPKGMFAYLTQALIFLLIIASVAIVVVEFWYRPIFHRYENLFHIVNFIILGVFTVEYTLRVTTAKNKFQYVRKPLNIVDFLAIAPNYIEFLLPFFVETTELRALRIIRLLRFMRILRAFRLFRYGTLLKKVFQYENTILEAITPVLIFFTITKTIVWVLEANRIWLNIQGLGELFAIIGFALGIILSQKIASTYDKFLEVEATIIRLYGSLRSLREILNLQKKGLGIRMTKEWINAFLSLLKNPKANNFEINDANIKLYKEIYPFEKAPADLAVMYSDICRDGAFCLSKKVRITPKAYDTLLHQSTMLYLGLIVVFIPGLTGLISIFVATYILYGMYNITQDLDSIFGGEFNLMNVDLTELEYLVDN